MYEYGSFDRTIVRDRVRQFEDQVSRRLAHVTRTYDRGYGHFTTRQNLQIN